MNSFSLLFFAAAAVVAVSGSAVYPVHHSPVTTQYHTQDEWGQYAYGYSGGPSAKHEQRTADGVTRGGYSYVDANGIVQSTVYESDPVNGFRASGTNFPANTVAAHPAAAVPVVAAPAPVHAPVVTAAPAHPWPVADEPAALPTVVDARHLSAAVPYSAVPYSAVPYSAVPYTPYSALSHAAVPVHHPLLKLSQPLTPAGTANVHYPEHAVLLASRKKRSAGLYPYPLASAYAAPPPAHVVTVKHAEVVAPPAPTVHSVVPSYVVRAPTPVATSYTSVVRHHPAPAAPVLAYAAPVPVVKHYAPVAPVVAHYAVAPVPAPVAVYAAAPQVAVAPVKTQYHSQDEHGQYTYGYTDGASAKTETRYADGVTKGSYSYVDDHGAVQAVHYTAGADGFQAAGTNIPVHHV